MDKTSSAALNQAIAIGEGRMKGIKFKSLGQEEETITRLSLERSMIDVGKALNSESVLDKGLKTYLNGFCDIARERICDFIKGEVDAEYDEKGRSFLRNTGSLGHQLLMTRLLKMYVRIRS